MAAARAATGAERSCRPGSGGDLTAFDVAVGGTVAATERAGFGADQRTCANASCAISGS